MDPKHNDMLNFLKGKRRRIQAGYVYRFIHMNFVLDVMRVNKEYGIKLAIPIPQ